MTPDVSVITPAFNAGKTLPEAIVSVQEQTFQSWEMIIIDDCSSDDTIELAEAFAKNDPRIRIVRQSKNGGVATARNVGLIVARSRYVAFLDSDDLWMPDKLQKQVAFMEQGDHAITYTQFRRFYSGKSNAEQHVAILPPEIDYETLLCNTGMACLTVMINIEKTGPLQFPQVRHEDYALWLKILRGGFKAYCLEEDLARYRVSATSVSGNKVKSILWVWNVYRHCERLGLLKSAWCLANYGYNRVKRYQG